VLLWVMFVCVGEVCLCGVCCVVSVSMSILCVVRVCECLCAFVFYIYVCVWCVS